MKASTIFPKVLKGTWYAPVEVSLLQVLRSGKLLKIFANLLLYFSSRWREPWAKLGLSERCLWGILRGPDNPFRLSSHRWVCSAAAPREITRLLSTYKIHLWNGMVLRQTCQIFFFFPFCDGEKCGLGSSEGQTKSKYECNFQNCCSSFMLNSLVDINAFF